MYILWESRIIYRVTHFQIFRERLPANLSTHIAYGRTEIVTRGTYKHINVLKLTWRGM